MTESIGPMWSTTKTKTWGRDRTTSRRPAPHPGKRTCREDHALLIVRDEFRPAIPRSGCSPAEPVSAYSNSGHRSRYSLQGVWEVCTAATCTPGFSPLKTFGTKNVGAGNPLLRIFSASPRSFVKSFEQRDALGPRTNSQMLSGFRLHYKPFERTESAREQEVAKPCRIC